jgi:RNA polymerase sigma-B factor
MLVVVGSSLTIADCAGLKPVIRDALASDAVSIDIDIADVTTMDAYAVRFVVEIRHKACQCGQGVRMIGANAEILDLIDAADPAGLLRAHDDPATAPPRTSLSCCGGTAPAHDDAIAHLLREAYALPHSDPHRAQLRARAIERALPSASRLAKRFAGRGEPADDLTQVAAIGLIKAVDRFDPREPAGFWPFATPTILGELRKHFRDKGWGVRVPRRLQDVWLQIRGEADGLVQRLGRSINTSDLAADLGLDESLIVEARLAGSSYAPASLSAPVLEGSVLADYIAMHEAGYAHVDDELTLRRALMTLPRRARHIVRLRFRHEMTQAQIAAAIGVSQMHVSRILNQAIATLREVIAVDDGPASGAPPARRAPATPGRLGAPPSRKHISPTRTT